MCCTIVDMMDTRHAVLSAVDHYLCRNNTEACTRSIAVYPRRRTNQHRDYLSTYAMLGKNARGLRSISQQIKRSTRAHIIYALLLPLASPPPKHFVYSHCSLATCRDLDTSTICKSSNEEEKEYVPWHHDTYLCRIFDIRIPAAGDAGTIAGGKLPNQDSITKETIFP